MKRTTIDTSKSLQLPSGLSTAESAEIEAAWERWDGKIEDADYHDITNAIIGKLLSSEAAEKSMNAAAQFFIHSGNFTDELFSDESWEEAINSAAAQLYLVRDVFRHREKLDH